MKPKNFDPEKTLQVIAETFAKTGYEATSLDDIMKSTGLGKQSLYNAFGDKKEMIKKSIECFGQDYPAFKILRDETKKGRERITEALKFIVDDAQGRCDSGCLITNLLLERGGQDQDVLKAADQKWHGTLKLIKKAVEAGIQDKSIKTSMPSELLALSIMNILNGLRVTFRTKTDFDLIKKMLKENLKALL